MIYNNYIITLYQLSTSIQLSYAHVINYHNFIQFIAG